MPLVSVLTAAHGERADLLVAAGNSLAGQELPAGWELEWVVQEDGDGRRFAEAVERFSFARYAGNGERLGPAGTRNLALARVRGELVHVLDSDDLVLPGGLAVAIAAFAAHPEVHWVCGQADDLLPDGTRVAVASHLPPGLIEPGMVGDYLTRYEMPPIHPAGLTLSTRTTRALGGWAALPRSEDTSLLIAVAELAPGWLTPEITWLYRKHGGQITGGADYPTLRPVSWTAVRQRIIALRESGLRLEGEA